MHQLFRDRIDRFAAMEILAIDNLQAQTPSRDRSHHLEEMSPLFSSILLTALVLSRQLKEPFSTDHLIELSEVVETDLRLRSSAQPPAHFLILPQVAQQPVSDPSPRHLLQLLLDRSQPLDRRSSRLPF